MAGNSDSIEDSLLREAVQLLDAHYPLRVLFRSILSRAGLDDPLPSGEVPTVWREIGRRDLGFEIRDLLLTYDPAMYAKLLGELVPEEEETYDAD